MGGECWNIFFIARGEVFGSENAPTERERAIEHDWVAGGAASRRSVDAKLEGIYILVDGKRQAFSKGGANITSGANCGRGAG